MKFTDALKKELRALAGLPETATDDQYKTALADALGSGKLTPAKLAELTTEKAAAAQQTSMELVVGKAVAAALEKAGVKPAALPPAKDPHRATDQTRGLAAVADVADPNVRVKDPSEKWSRKKWVGKHATTGEPVEHLGSQVELPSELEFAKAGVWFHNACLHTPAIMQQRHVAPLREEEKALLEEIYAKDWFTADGQEDFIAPISGLQVKALLDESGGSGGQGLVPIWFDELIVTFPLLHSEVFPYVEIVEPPRGSRMVGASLGNPTVSWGTAEGTSLTLFNTASLAAEIDTTIYPVMVAVEVGIDFLSDSPVNVGQMLQTNIGQSALKEWDNVIVNGNGTTQPQGITAASGTTTTNSVNGVGGALEVDDAETQVFGLAKQYRARTAWNSRHIMTDTAYKRFRQIPVSGADQRRVFGMDHQSYQLLEYPASIQNSLANNTIIFGALKKYRLYRRRGFDMRMVTEGITLALKNTVVVLGRGRFGGKVMDGSAFVLMKDAGAA